MAAQHASHQCKHWSSHATAALFFGALFFCFERIREEDSRIGAKFGEQLFWASRPEMFSRIQEPRIDRI